MDISTEKAYFSKHYNPNSMRKTITKEVIKNFLDNNSVEFKSTHHKLSLPIINRIYKKMVNGINFDDIKVCDDLIIDGHHRYISSLVAGVKIGITKYPKSSATITYDWKTIDFTETEWDTEDKIQHLNELDAEFNNIEIDKINEIIK
jgi:hypothetical protein